MVEDLDCYILGYDSVIYRVAINMWEKILVDYCESVLIENNG
jgi:hypothetical protein